MKKLFLLALVVGSTVAQANSAFEFEIEHSPSVLGESKNYEARHVNQDLTVSIVNPKFSNPNGALALSTLSDMNGVCKLYGLNSFVSYDYVIDAHNKIKSVVIDSSSRFSAFAKEITAIKTIICNTAEIKTTPVSDNYEGMFNNDDGSVTITEPRFMISGVNMRLSTDSDKTGVCKLYGLTSYVPNSDAYYYVPDADSYYFVGAGRALVIDGSAKMIPSGKKEYAIKSLICR